MAVQAPPAALAERTLGQLETLYADVDRFRLEVVPQLVATGLPVARLQRRTDEVLRDLYAAIVARSRLGAHL